MSKYNIPEADQELVRACYEAADAVIVDLRNNPHSNRKTVYSMDDIPSYRNAMAAMFLQIDLHARTK